MDAYSPEQTLSSDVAHVAVSLKPASELLLEISTHGFDILEQVLFSDDSLDLHCCRA